MSDHFTVRIVIGALAALASYALFHLVTVFPLCWVLLFTAVLLLRYRRLAVTK